MDKLNRNKDTLSGNSLNLKKERSQIRGDLFQFCVASVPIFSEGLLERNRAKRLLNG